MGRFADDEWSGGRAWCSVRRTSEGQTIIIFMTDSLDSSLARLDSSLNKFKIAAGTLQELQEVDFGGPLHSLIVCGELHELELEVLKEYLIEGTGFEESDTGKETENDDCPAEESEP